MKEAIDTERFYKVDKALQLVEGTNVAALWAHLIDSYNYFKGEDMITIENTLFQAAKVVQAFTGVGIKAQATAKKRLEKLGFLKYKVATVPGHATKTTHYILFPEVYANWTEQHDYDELRDQKYKELQPESDHDKLDQWVKDNMTDAQKQTLSRLNQKQNALGTFANHTEGHLQSSPGSICKVPDAPVIETIEVETKELENTQTNKDGCVYGGELFPYLKGKTKNELLDLIIETYRNTLFENQPDDTSSDEFEETRFIGSLDAIENEFSKLEIDVAVNCYIGILGYLDSMEDELYSNPKRFTAAYKLENLFRFNQSQIVSRNNMKRGERVYESLYKPKKSKKSL